MDNEQIQGKRVTFNRPRRGGVGGGIWLNSAKERRKTKLVHAKAVVNQPGTSSGGSEGHYEIWEKKGQPAYAIGKKLLLGGE